MSTCFRGNGVVRREIVHSAKGADLIEQFLRVAKRCQRLTNFPVFHEQRPQHGRQGVGKPEGLLQRDAPPKGPQDADDHVPGHVGRGEVREVAGIDHELVELARSVLVFEWQGHGNGRRWLSGDRRMYPGRPCPPRSGVGVGVGAAHVWAARLLSTMEARQGGAALHTRFLPSNAWLSERGFQGVRWAADGGGIAMRGRLQARLCRFNARSIPAMKAVPRCRQCPPAASLPVAWLQGLQACQALGHAGRGRAVVASQGARRGVFADAQVPVKTGFLRSAFAWTPSAKSAEFMAH